MKKGTNKTDNYFERVKQRLHPPKYRYYFFDYLYFKGEQWSKKAFRCSGAFILLEYWIMIVAFGIWIHECNPSLWRQCGHILSSTDSFIALHFHIFSLP